MKLKELREKLKISQRQLAIKLNVSPQNLNRYETGINEPNIQTLCKLADFFNVSIDELVERETENVNLKFINETKREMIKQILALNDNTAEKVNAFLQGMLLAEKEREEIKEFMRNKRNGN